VSCDRVNPAGDGGTIFMPKGCLKIVKNQEKWEQQGLKRTAHSIIQA
jgi:hypothetical protein